MDLLYSDDFYRGLLSGIIMVGMAFFAYRVFFKHGWWDVIRDYFRFWMKRRADFDTMMDQIVELKNSNVELGDKVIKLSNENSVYESTCETYDRRYNQLERDKKHKDYMIARLADHCASLDPRTPRAQFLVSAQTHAENEMEKNGD